MRIICWIVLSMMVIISSLAQAEAHGNFSVKKGNISIITVGSMQVAVSNDGSGDCGTFYVINPVTQEILGTGSILENKTAVLIDNDRMDIICVFAAVGSKNNPTLESRPLVTRN